MTIETKIRYDPHLTNNRGEIIQNMTDKVEITKELRTEGRIFGVKEIVDLHIWNMFRGEIEDRLEGSVSAEAVKHYLDYPQEIP